MHRKVWSIICGYGYKRSKERVTIAASTNASGINRLLLLCTGKSAHPREFKIVTPNDLPLYYKNKKTTSLAKLFKSDFYEDFVHSVDYFFK